MGELSRVEIEEVVIAAPSSDEENPWVFSGDVSDLMEYIFGPEWHDYMYDEYPQYYWSDMLQALQEHDAPVEVVFDMVYDFGASSKEEVKEYMDKYKDAGNRFLIMPRTDTITMACAWFRGFEVRPISSI